MAIKNIIFDLGVVILAVDTSKTKAAFEKLGVKNFDSLYSLKKQSNVFDDFEKGIISDAAFRNAIRHSTKLNLSDIEIDFAWNAMIGDIPQERFDFLSALKNKYRIFLCSNTNTIHCCEFLQKLNNHYGYGNFEKLFEKIYYSFKHAMRKPEAEFYNLILRENNLVASETMLVDDNEKNTESARNLNINTWLFPPTEKIEEKLIEALKKPETHRF